MFEDKLDYFYDCFSVLPTEAPHNAALQPEVVLRSTTEVRVKVLNLNRPQ